LGAPLGRGKTAAMGSKRKKRRRWAEFTPLAWLIYIALRCFVFAVQLLPRQSHGSFGRVVGRLLQLVDRKHARIARSNLERSEGVVTGDAIPAFLDRVYAGVGRSIIELALIPRWLRRGELRSKVRCEGLERFDACLAEGHGGIIATGHMGNYELGFITVASAGYPLSALARPIPNRFVDGYVSAVRSQTGGKIIPTDRSIREMLKVLRGNGLLGIETDMDAKSDGVIVDFLGRPASMHRSAALFSLRCDSPVLVVCCFREEGENVLRVYEPIRPSDFRGREDALEAMTQAIATRFEMAVREHPEDWLWLLDRWRGGEKLMQRRDAERA